ncbi:slx1, partial [Symbiodinium sp. KB8]
MYQVKTFEMAIRLGHAAVSLQDLGGLAARWLFSVRGAAGAPELRGESAFADEVSQVARNISWHHRAEVEVGPYMLDFAAVSTDGHDQENPPDGWDENKPGRSLARYCVAVEADGPTHFYRPHGKPWHWTSTSKLRHRLLSAMRIRVAHVPFFDWLQLEGLAQKEAYLTELLLKVHSSPFPSLKLEAPAGSLDVQFGCSRHRSSAAMKRRKLALGSDVQAAPPLLVQSIDTDLTDLPSSTEAPSGALAETQRVKEKHSETNPDYKYCADEEESKEKLSPHQPDLTAGDGPLEWDLLDLASNHFKRRFGSKSVVTTPSGKDDDSFMLSFAFRDFIQQGVVTESEADKLTVKYCFAAGYFDEYGTRRTCAEPAEPPNASAVGAERTRGSYIRRKVTMRKHYDDRLPVQHQGPPGRGRLFSEAFQWIDTWLDELKAFWGYLVLAFLPQSPGLESLDACPSGTAECYARVTDDPYEEDLFLLQHSAVREADEINASKAALQTLSPEPGSTEGPLVRLLHLISSIRHRAAARWGWGSSDPKPPTPEEACTSGLFFKYSDVKLEENLEATFSLHSHGADCSSKSAFGPNECCLQFGTDIGVTIQAVLPQNLTQNAVMHTRVSAWYGWIPLWDSMSCKICGEPCRACPSISQYLPSLFPCEPTPMPDCPIPAGSVTNSANVTLPLDVQQKAKGSKDLIKKEASAQDSRRPEAQRVREAETKQKRVDEHMRSCETWTLSRTYIGFTMDPRRRLRQHNGEIKGVDKNVRVLLEMLQAIPYN